MVYKVESAADFKAKLVEAAEKLVVVDFFAPWCGPCKQIEPHVVQLSEEMSDVVFLKVNVDDIEELAVEYNIESMPTFVFIKNGERVHSFSGANLETLKKAIAQHK